MRYLLMTGILFAFAVTAAAQNLTVETMKETVTEEKEHEVVVANTLWDLAEHYYKDPWQWPRIYEANKELIKDPHWIYPGMDLIIPGLGKSVTVVRELPEPAPEPEPAPPPPPKKKYKPYEGGEVLADSLSTELPRGMAGQQPAMFRMRKMESWEPAGEVLEYMGRESIVSQGDHIRVRVSDGGKVSKGAKFSVFRWAARTDADRDEKGKFIPGSYVQKVGLIKVDRKYSADEYRALILKSGGSIQLGDVLDRAD